MKLHKQCTKVYKTVAVETTPLLMNLRLQLQSHPPTFIQMNEQKTPEGSRSNASCVLRIWSCYTSSSWISSKPQKTKTMTLFRIDVTRDSQNESFDVAVNDCQQGLCGKKLHLKPASEIGAVQLTQENPRVSARQIKDKH